MQGVQPRFFQRLPASPVIWLMVVLGLVPLAFIGGHVHAASRDIAYWDEFDTAINLVLQLDSGLGPRDFLSRLFEVSNEHRMVTSRLMFAASFWLTGTVDFEVISWIGNASLLALCVLLILTAGSLARGLQLGVILSLLMFQLEHYENFLWSGSSIDHFQVVLLAGGAVVGVARRSRLGLLLAALCAMLATFTLAHGSVVWAVGGAMLAREKRWRHLGLWAAVTTAAMAGFLAGFHLNTAQRFADPSFAGALLIARYWLSLLGAVPALGSAAAAPWLGGLLLVSLAWVGLFRGAGRHEPIAFPLACYAVLALGLIAVGRAAESGGVVHSRYYVLSALAWALVLFTSLQRLTDPRRPYRFALVALPLLVAFNITANQAFAAKADSWLECRDRAAVRYTQHGVDGRGPFSLYPVPERSTRLLDEVGKRGIYTLPTICEERSFPEAQPSGRISYFVEEMDVSEKSAILGGWAAIPGVRSERGQIHVVLRSPEKTYVFTSVTITRPDVAAALNRPECALSGFRFARPRGKLPTGEFQVGFLFKNGRATEYIMTDHRLRLVGEGKALLASTD